MHAVAKRLKVVSLVASLFVLIVASHTNAIADQPAATANLTAEQTFHKCLQALQDNQFETYLNYLTDDEIRFQAGMVLFVERITDRATLKSSDPETYLLMLSFSDLIEQHLADGLEAGQELTPAQATAQEIRGQFMSMVIAQAMAGQFQQLPPQAAIPYPHPAMPATTKHQLSRETLIKSSALLKDPRTFLVDVFTELGNPVQVTGFAAPENQPETEQERRNPIVNFAQAMQQGKWTFYQRGAYAVAKMEQPDLADGESGSAAPEFVVEMTQRDGTWKLNNLYPMSMFANRGELNNR